jgi:lysozyme family protein
MVSYLPTSLAHVWLLTGVHSGMYRQRRALNKLLTTARVVANVRSDSSMYPL